MRRVRIDLVIGDVAFLFQNADDLRLDLRVRDKHLRLLRARAVAHAGEKVGNRISNSTHVIQLGRLRSRRRGFLRPVAERHSHFAQERFGFLVRPRGGDDCNIKTDVALDFIELDFGKNRLVGNAERVVAVAVEAARRNSAKIANARQRRLDQALEKLIHPLAAQRHLGADRLVLAQLEIRDALLRARLGRLLAGDQGQLRLRVFQRLLHVRLANRPKC